VAFLKEKLHSYGLFVISLAIAICGSIVAMSSTNVQDVVPRYAHNTVTGYSVVPGPLSWVITASYIVLTILLIGRFTMVRAHVDSQTRVPLRIIQPAILLVIVVSLVTNIFAPIVIGGSYLAIVINNMSLVAFVGILAVAVLKYRLLDVQLFVLRAVAYLTTLFISSLLLIFPLALVFDYYSGYRPTPDKLIVIVVVGGIVFTLSQYLKNAFDKLTSRIFFRNYYDPQIVLDEIGAIIVHTTEIDLLQEMTRNVVSKHLKSKSVGFLLFAADSQADHIFAQSIKRNSKAGVISIDNLQDDKKMAAILDDKRTALVLALRTKKEELGYIALGYKQSGETYSASDIKLMGVIANEVAIALQNALRFEEIERFNETLQKKVDERTYQLRQANKKLKKLNDSKDDFVGMTSHQLRTPLTSIKGYVSLVMDGDAGKVNETQRKLLSQAFNSSQKMVYLIADLLNVSRLKTGKFTIERKPTNLSLLVRDEVEQLKEEAAGRKIALDYEAPETFPILPLDDTKTRQVLMNFIDNAIYYTQAGGHIRVELKETPKSVEFRVIDDGIGVPKDERHHLFTKFYRAKNALRARPDGTGLGLYMSRKVITAQGGAIIFDSEEGKGSTFGFIFPKELPTEPVALPPQTRD
jgi:signal transduction histidine kinase